jgi:hypothetical protein
MTVYHVSTERKIPRLNAVHPTLGIVVAVVPFFASYRESRERSVTTGLNGTEIRSVVHKMRFDYIGVSCGGCAVVLGLVAIVRAIPKRRWFVVLAGVLSLALGLFQVVRAFAI